MRMATEWSECRVDLEPAGREIVWDLEQRLELVDRLLRLTHEEVDAHELVPDVRPVRRLFGERRERYGALALAHRLGFAAQVGQRQPVERVELGVLGRPPELLFKGESGRVGVDPRCCRAAATALPTGEAGTARSLRSTL